VDNALTNGNVAVLEDSMGDLRTQRKMAGWTQFQLAQRSGVSRMKLSLVECGQAELSANEETAVRQALITAIQARAAELSGLLTQESTSRRELQPA
jgi:transcriptional regulator with XRE-family HTH domain